ncbi:hypothetical protein SPF06_11955 [Sinomonas sp. JGH33]|uniref:Uncharacterized protein n=1 Tax=Sinomonas terricola TaxID=3110330 RepID=A0ABU5T700_9MICC|nr:hypothetical protein [Sinomonas sp. JGH33]MEA5455437.1 hypothetical protein [Sinomonas sp. JGH33]
MAEEARRLAGELRWLDGIGESPDDADNAGHRTMASLDAHEVTGLARQLLELDGIVLGPDNEVRSTEDRSAADPPGSAEQAQADEPPARDAGPASGRTRPRRRRP